MIDGAAAPAYARALATGAVLAGLSCLVALAAAALLQRRGAAVRHHALAAGVVACIVAPAAAMLPSIVVIDASFSPLVAPQPMNASAALALGGQQLVASAALPVAPTLVALWAIGVLWFASRAARHWRAASHMRSRATRVIDAEWLASLKTCHAAAPGAGDVELLMSREVDVPLVLGLRGPAIVVPVSAGEWSREQRRVVLLHELAHVERRDLVMRVLGTAACAVHWWNPLVWMLAQRLDDEAEHCADDVVLQCGVRASSYADVLLGFAERLRARPTPRAALALARRATIGSRVRAVLAPATRRPTSSGGARSACLTLGAVIATAAGGVRVERAQPLAAPQSGATARVVSGSAPSGVTAPTVQADRPISKMRRAASVRAPLIEPDLSVAADWKEHAIAGLVALSNDPSPQVRASAEEALTRLRDQKRPISRGKGS